MRPLKIVEEVDRPNHGVETRRELLIFSVTTIILLGTSFMVYMLGFRPLALVPGEGLTTSGNVRNSLHGILAG
ncbi:hypothetical protein M434DRAFT_400029 [Hypoxylon sp. CO27-5]|nr:hypothetical protein M434DRAFT_400029 [Hypoxylon sp. CO27-5]